MAPCKKLHHSIEWLQADLDAWRRDANTVRAHQGCWRPGKIPIQTFVDTPPLAKKKLPQAA